MDKKEINKMNGFKVSIIIPAFNAENYILRAIESAVSLESVTEVIVIDDGSKDSTLKICKQLADKNNKIIILTHPGNINKGVSATRNLGIKKAKSEFIAFLDSDDYYLANRFEAEKELYQKYKDFEGAYNASEWIWKQTGKRMLFSIKEYTESKDLFKTLLWHHKGLFDTNSITIKKELLNKTGYFDENMEVAEDMDLWYRIAVFGNIYTGNIYTPTSERIIHGENVIITANDKYKNSYKYMHKKILKKYLKSDKISFDNKNEILLVFNNYNYIFEKTYSEIKFVIKLLSKFRFLLFYSFIYRKIFQLIKNYFLTLQKK